jgi:hypothetical protein
LARPDFPATAVPFVFHIIVEDALFPWLPAAQPERPSRGFDVIAGCGTGAKAGLIHRAVVQMVG